MNSDRRNRRSNVNHGHHRRHHHHRQPRPLRSNSSSAVEINNKATEQSSQWYHASFHVIASMVGAGVLGLPRAFAFLTWPGALIAMLMAFIVTLFTSFLLANMHFFEQHRVRTLREVGQRLFGERLGLWLIVPPQMVVVIGTAIAYIILSGEILQSIDKMYGDDISVRLTSWFALFCVIQLLLSLLPSLQRIRWLSLLAVVCSIVYCAIVIGLCASVGIQKDVSYALPSSSSSSLQVRGVLEALGIVAFAFGGHSIMVEVQATIKGNDEDADGGAKVVANEMKKGVKVAYVAVFVLYFGVGVIGYLVFGEAAADDILLSLAHRASNGVYRDLVAFAQFLVYIHITFAFQVYMQLFYELIEEKYPLKDEKSSMRLLRFRLLRRWPAIFIQFLVAAAFPFFGDLIGFIGAVAITSMTFVLPPVMFYFYTTRKGYGEASSMQLAACLFVVVVYALVGLGGGVASFWALISSSSSNFKFFQ